MFSSLVLLMAATWFGFALIGDSWFQLLIAAALGILCTQLSFLAHEAGHRQIFASRRANDWAARLLATSVAGISYFVVGAEARRAPQPPERHFQGPGHRHRRHRLLP